VVRGGDKKYPRSTIACQLLALNLPCGVDHEPDLHGEIVVDPFPLDDPTYVIYSKWIKLTPFSRINQVLHYAQLSAWHRHKANDRLD
jgi:hypothetical protein